MSFLQQTLNANKPVGHPDYPEYTTTLDSDAKKRLDAADLVSLIEAEFTTAGQGCSVHIREQGVPIFEYQRGAAEFGTGLSTLRPVTPATAFYMGDAGEMFIGALAAFLIDSGSYPAVTRAALISALLPGITEQGATVENIGWNESGLHDYEDATEYSTYGSTFNQVTQEPLAAYDLIKGLAQEFAVGTSHAFRKVNYGLLAEIAESQFPQSGFSQVFDIQFVDRYNLNGDECKLIVNEPEQFDLASGYTFGVKALPESTDRNVGGRSIAMSPREASLALWAVSQFDAGVTAEWLARGPQSSLGAGYYQTLAGVETNFGSGHAYWREGTFRGHSTLLAYHDVQGVTIAISASELTGGADKAKQIYDAIRNPLKAAGGF